MEIERTINGVEYLIDITIEAHDEFWVESILRVVDGEPSEDVDTASKEGTAVIEAIDLGEVVADYYADRADTYRDLQDDR